MSRSATPKQIAYLSYMGVSNAQELSFESASAAISGLFDSSDPSLYGQLYERQSDWITERFVLHPDLYANEIQRMLDEELPEVFHAYVRGRMVGASEKLTKIKIKKVISSLLVEDVQWWQSRDKKEIFYQRLTELYPACVDGCMPEKRSTPKVVVRSKLPPKGSGCIVVFCGLIFSIVFLAFLTITNG